MITVTALENGAAVQFPYDAERIARLKARFPKARWGAGTSSWHIHGKLAAKRAEAWAAEEQGSAQPDPYAGERIRDADIFEHGPMQSHLVRTDRSGYTVRMIYSEAAVALIKTVPTARWEKASKSWRVDLTATAALRAILPELERAVPDGQVYFRGLAEEGRKMSTAHVIVRTSGATISVQSPYSDAIVSALRKLGGTWHKDSKRWVLPINRAEGLHALMPELESHAIKAAAERDEMQARREADQAVASERRARRWPVTSGQMVTAGIPTRLGRGRRAPVVVVESYGKSFRCDENLPSLGYSHLLGHEGEKVGYAYYRMATEAETAELEAREAEARSRAKTKASALKTERALAERIRSAGERPSEASWPEGETLLELNAHLRIYGGGVTWLLTSDGRLWRIEGNGADGDDWSANNLPGAIGWCVRAEEPMVSDLRKIAEVI